MLDRLEPLRLLAYRSVQKEIDLSEKEIELFQALLERDGVFVGDVASKSANSNQDQDWLNEAEALSQSLSEWQWKRLRELQKASSFAVHVQVD